MHLFIESGTGIRVRVYDIVIPTDFADNELGTYLDDIFHESASDKHPKVVRLS
ncbi:DUF7661 family protein [Shewanella sp. 125m-7]